MWLSRLPSTEVAAYSVYKPVLIFFGLVDGLNRFLKVWQSIEKNWHFSFFNVMSQMLLINNRSLWLLLAVICRWPYWNSYETKTLLSWKAVTRLLLEDRPTFSLLHNSVIDNLIPFSPIACCSCCQNTRMSCYRWNRLQSFVTSWVSLFYLSFPTMLYFVFTSDSFRTSGCD